MQTASPCTACGGSGQIIDKRPSNSDSQGFVIDVETVSIKIPAGVVDGMQLKVTGKGNASPGNGVSGDLLVAITEESHPTLQREGDNLHYDLYVSLSEAILGSSIEIDTVTGKVRLKIEAGVQSKIKDFLLDREHDLEEFAPKKLTDEQQAKITEISNFLTGKASSSFSGAKQEAKPSSDDFEFEDNFAKTTATTASASEDEDDFFNDL